MHHFLNYRSNNLQYPLMGYTHHISPLIPLLVKSFLVVIIIIIIVVTASNLEYRYTGIY